MPARPECVLHAICGCVLIMDDVHSTVPWQSERSTGVVGLLLHETRNRTADLLASSILPTTI